MDPHGMPGDPCTEAERREKFSRLAACLEPATRAAIESAVLGCEQLRSARDLLEPLRNQ